MPKFDTYKGIEKYAREPNNPAARLSFNYVKHIADLNNAWEALDFGGIEDLANTIELKIGAFTKEVQQTSSMPTALQLAAMPEDKRTEMFVSLCNSVGLSIDPKTLMTTP